MKDDESANHIETTVVRLGLEEKDSDETEAIVEPSFSIDKDPYVIEMDLPNQWNSFDNETTEIDMSPESLSSFIDYQGENDSIDNI